MINSITEEINNHADPKKARLLSRFFKTGKGEYGEGDIFLGLVVPIQRKIANQFKNLSITNIQKLLNSKIHEYRLIALIILTIQYKKFDESKKRIIYELYLKNTVNINNWDLVDLTAPHIVGGYLLNKDQSILFDLAKSKNLWERRIAILSTFTFIRNNKFKEALKISKILIKDKHDLIHKAVGWMLREIGKRDLQTEELFLKKYYKIMPRTMLRYAIEKFPETKRRYYLDT